MKIFHFRLVCAALVLVTAFASAAVAAETPDDELPPGDAPIIMLNDDTMTVRDAVGAISAATKWQIFCTDFAGKKQFVMYTQNMAAGEILKSIVRSQGLVYRVDGMAIYVMTRQEYNETYGGAREVIQLTYAPAERVAAALEKLAVGKTAKITAVPEASAVVIYGSPVDIAVLREVAAGIDRPLETVVVPLENALAADVVSSLQSFISPAGRISAEAQSNQVVIRDVEGKVRILEEIARKMDLPSSRITREFRLKYADCNAVAQYLADMFGLRASAAGEPVVRGSSRSTVPPRPAASSPGSSPAGNTGRRSSGRARYFGGETGPTGAPVRRPRNQATADRLRRAFTRALQQESSAAVGTVVADPRTNSVWVTDTPGRIEQIAEVISGLDTSIETKVYQMSYADVTQIADKVQGILTSTFDRLEVDERTRRISVTTTPEKMAQILELLEQWDTQPRQVFITGKVLSVNRDRLRDLGVSYDALFHQMDEHLGTEVQATGAFLPAIAPTPKGSLRVGNLTEDNFTVLIEALESDSTTRLLSSPRVLVIDGNAAQFSVATEEPYTEVVIEGDTGTTTENVKFKQVGVTLQVQPVITKDDKISMAVNLDVSSLQEIRNGVPVVSRSLMTSNVVVADTQPLVIGGLIVDEDVDAVNKVPLLGDIPILGALFRYTHKDRSQRELVLVMIPSIVSPGHIVSEPTLSEIEQDLKNAPFLEGEKGEGATPAGGGVSSKGRKDADEPAQE